MKRTLIATAAAIALLGSVATVNTASAFDKNPAGAMLGAAAGGYVGSHIGRGDGRLVATAMGTLIGAVVGYNVTQNNGHATTSYRNTYRYQPAPRHAYQAPRYQAPRYQAPTRRGNVTYVDQRSYTYIDQRTTTVNRVNNNHVSYRYDNNHGGNHATSHQGYRNTRWSHR